MMNNTYHVIKDPVHGTMQFTSIEDAWVKPFIDSLAFQRLRHIKQLGMADYIFPGAVHTRFNHCLGCCYIGGQIAHKIGLADQERQLVMIACLLHDIGHGPFSHTFEDIFIEKFIRHEDWTPYFLQAYNTETFFSFYNELNPSHPLGKPQFAFVMQMIMHLPVENTLLADIVSSQLDADRFDYLLRDSHFCGVKYGEFDFRWMLHCLAIINTTQGRRLGITHKGIGVVEHYLMARRLMTRNIYHASKKLALEYFLIELMKYLAMDLAHHGSYANIRHSRLGQFLIAANELNASIQLGIDKLSAKEAFLKANFSHYQSLCDYDIYALICDLSTREDSSAITQLAKRLQHRRMPKILPVEGRYLPVWKQELAAFKQNNQGVFEDWQLAIIQNPHRSYNKNADPILVNSLSGGVESISHVSITIEAISDRLEYSAFLSIDSAIADDIKVKQFIKHLVR